MYRGMEDATETAVMEKQIETLLRVGSLRFSHSEKLDVRALEHQPMPQVTRDWSPYTLNPNP